MCGGTWCSPRERSLNWESMAEQFEVVDFEAPLQAECRSLSFLLGNCSAAIAVINSPTPTYGRDNLAVIERQSLCCLPDTPSQPGYLSTSQQPPQSPARRRCTWCTARSGRRSRASRSPRLLPTLRPSPPRGGPPPAVAMPTIRALGVRPFFAAVASSASSRAQAPSFTPLALPAVTVPS